MKEKQRGLKEMARDGNVALDTGSLESKSRTSYCINIKGQRSRGN